MSGLALTWAIPLNKTQQMAYAGIVHISVGQQDQYTDALENFKRFYIPGRQCDAAQIVISGKDPRQTQICFDDDVPPPVLGCRARQPFQKGEKVAIGVNADPVNVKWPRKGAAGFVYFRQGKTGTDLLWHLGPMWLFMPAGCEFLFNYLFPSKKSIAAGRSKEELFGEYDGDDFKLGDLSGAVWLAFGGEYMPFELRDLAYKVRKALNVKDIDRVETPSESEKEVKLYRIMDGQVFTCDETGQGEFITPSTDEDDKDSDICPDCWKTLTEKELYSLDRYLQASEQGYSLSGKRGNSLVQFLGSDYWKIMMGVQRAKRKLSKCPHNRRS